MNVLDYQKAAAESDRMDTELPNAVVMPLWQYVLLFAWPGLSLTLLRSFTEHRPVDALDQRTIIIEGSLLTRLLFLNNNYHQVHHFDPGLVWYRIADRYRQNRDRVIRENGGFYFSSYFDLCRNYLFRIKDSPVYPMDIRSRPPMLPAGNSLQ